MAANLSRVETIFNEAVDIPVPQERAAFLDRACGIDADLRKRVDALLAAHDATEDVLRLPYAARTLEAPVLSEGPGTIIGRYKLLEQIGEGGFGVVFMAEQQQPVRRKVALKIIKLGMDTKLVIARFEAERQALAMMDHSNIAHVFDAGATEAGRPYFVMELVRGIPITDYCDQNKLSTNERLELFMTVCSAVQHAHTKGIIHRDIKPTNVLVTLNDGVTVAKVIDFGIAKATGQQLTEKTLFTNFAQMIGTPLYMSPEQTEMSSIDVDTRSDIYSLGVLLYELLTGTTPLDRERMKKSAFDEIFRIIREEEPPRPSTRLSTMDEKASMISAAQRKGDPKNLGRLVRGELDWIVMKALEKQRSRRYETANGLARDIERYLRNEAVEACPPSAAYRFRKFASRNRHVLIAAAIIFAVLLAGVVVSSWEAIRANRATLAERAMREQATESEARAVASATISQRQGHRANQYFLNAREVFDQMAARLDDPKLLVHPEVASLRKKLLEDLLSCYQKIVDDNAVDSASIQEKASALRMVADIEDMLGDPAKAEKAYRDAIAIREPYVAQHPDRLESYQVLATCYAFLGDLLVKQHRTTEAEAAYHRALVLWAPLATDLTYSNSIYAGSLYNYHKVLFDLLEHGGQSDAARALCAELLAPFEESAAHSPQDVNLQLRLADALCWDANLLYGTGRDEEARKLYDRAVELYGKLPPTTAPSDRARFVYRYGNRANLLLGQQRFAEAASTFRKAIELDPENATLYYNLGWALASQKRFDESIAAYKKSVALAPDRSSGYSALAWELALCSDMKLRDSGQAIALAKKSLELDPDHPTQASMALGVAYYQTGDFKAAIAVMNNSMKGNNGGSSYQWFILAMSDWKLGERDAARESYNKAIDSMQKYQPGSEYLIRLRSEASQLLGMPTTRTTALISQPASQPATRSTFAK